MQDYLKGIGLDVSRQHYIKEASHNYISPDNLYLLRNCVGIEKLDFLYSRNLINETKYYRILLYEWFLVIKNNGFIIIEFQDNEILDYNRLLEEISTLLLYKGRQRIVFQQHIGRNNKIVLQKLKSTYRPENEINQWSFGIVTNGRRKDFIAKAVNSIRNLNIPEYEIILCGTYNQDVGEDMKYIHFSEQDDRGWITKKKNLICENARFENIAVIHDRIYFDENWFLGMKKYGNYFDVLSNLVMLFLKDGKSVASNWEALKNGFKLEDDKKLFHTNGMLDFSDWDKNVIIPGPLIILKKSVWELEKWNENFFWGEAEDIEYSYRQYRNGIMLRLNPYALSYACSISGITYRAYYEKNSKRLGRYHSELNFFLILCLKVLDFLGFRRNQRLTQFCISRLKKVFSASSWKEEKNK